jgi:hypothetical protein
VIGQFATSGDATQRTLVVTNWNHDAASASTLTAGQNVKQVLLEDQPGNRPPRTVTGPVKLKLPPGAFALVTLKNVYG